MQKIFKAVFLIGFLFFFGCTSKKPPLFYPKFQVKPLPQFPDGTPPLLVRIEDRRPVGDQPPPKTMIAKLKKSLKLIYGKQIQWVELDNAVPERAYAELFIKNLQASYKAPYWKAKSSVYIKYVDRRVALKEVVKETTFNGAHQKVDIPWENTKGQVLKKAWDKVSHDVLKGFNQLIREKP